MEIELGLKITQTRYDLASATDVRIAKDRAGPVFSSKEHDNMFILTAYLRGFKRENIEIKINEDGTRIMVGGEKPVQEMVMIGWMVYKKRVELRGFRKVFKIPDGVVLDRIKAKFDEEEAILTIVMPKREKGISGVRIEEVKEEEVERERGKPDVADAVLERGNVGMEVQEESKEPEIKITEGSERVVEKKTDRKASKKVTFVEEVLKKETTKERTQEESKEPGIQSMVEPDQIAEEEADKGGHEETKTVAEFPKEEYIGEKLPEKTAEPTMEETDGVGRGKPEAVQTDKEPKRERETREPESTITEETRQVAETPEETKKIEHHRELVGAAKHPEVATMKPTTEETWSRELPELSEQTKKQDIPKEEVQVQEKGLEEEHLHGSGRVEPSHTVVDQVSHQSEIPHQPSSHQTEVEEKGTKGEFRQAEHEMPQEPQKQEAHLDVRESKKPDQEPQQAETLPPERPVEKKHDKKEVMEREETHGVENEVQEASNERSSQEKESESSEAGKQKAPGEQETQENQLASKRCKLGVPCVVAGSALFISLMVFVIHKIRTKKDK
ncbi:hypothetical protein FH972_018319 [Carpinus fangiana]|uniref:SHSP domain-containing protein n=1 Tax=Carpinus fangiana TaxID=176857 RepID=A0A5N6RQ71_9ROSI|nr:hypothetical protein FH972_018319 [Carpinus fangiana]